MPMATTDSRTGAAGTPVERLRSSTDTDVTIITSHGPVTGSVLSCTRGSVWLISDDEDHVIPIAEILDVVDVAEQRSAEQRPAA